MTTKTARILIPTDLPFAALDLKRRSDGGIEFNIEPIERICAVSGLDVAMFEASEDNLCALIVAWYDAARAGGEPPDPVAEALADEAEMEERCGQGFSLPPGRA